MSESLVTLDLNNNYIEDLSFKKILKNEELMKRLKIIRLSNLYINIRK